MHRYVVVGLVPPPWATWLEGLRRYDFWTRHWLPPHVTIIRPFYAELTPDAIRTMSNWPIEMPIRMGPWRSFKQPNANVVWVDPGQDGPRTVQQALIRRFSPPLPVVEGRRDTFHITAAFHIPDREFDTVWWLLSKHHLSGQFVIDRLRIFQEDPESKNWRPV